MIASEPRNLAAMGESAFRADDMCDSVLVTGGRGDGSEVSGDANDGARLPVGRLTRSFARARGVFENARKCAEVGCTEGAYGVSALKDAHKGQPSTAPLPPTLTLLRASKLHRDWPEGANRGDSRRRTYDPDPNPGSEMQLVSGDVLVTLRRKMTCARLTRGARA